MHGRGGGFILQAEYSALSRAVVAVTGSCLIINLPGAPKVRSARPHLATHSMPRITRQATPGITLHATPRHA